MTKVESKLEDDDFSISASKSIIKSPIPVDRDVIIRNIQIYSLKDTSLYPTRCLRIQNLYLLYRLDFLSSLCFDYYWLVFYYYVPLIPPRKLISVRHSNLSESLILP